MASVREIVDALGRERRVEEIILRIAGLDALTPNLQDLAQMVYLELLQFPEDKLDDLWRNEQINYLLVGIIRKSINSQTSRYYYIIRRFSLLSCDLTGMEYKTEQP